MILTDAYSIEDLIFKWRVDAPAVEMIRASLPEYTVTGVSNIDCTQFSEGKELKELRKLSVFVGFVVSPFFIRKHIFHYTLID